MGKKLGLAMAGTVAVHGTNLGLGIPGVNNNEISYGIISLNGSAYHPNTGLMANLNLTASDAAAAIKVGNNFVVLGADGTAGAMSLWLRMERFRNSDCLSIC